MNKKVIFILLVFSLIFVIGVSGCETPEEKTDDTTIAETFGVDTEDSANAIEESSDTTFDTTTAATSSEDVAPTAGDVQRSKYYCYAAAADAKQDNSVCNKIADKKLAADCKLYVSDSKSDPSVCARLSDPVFRDLCYTSVATYLLSPKNCDNVKNICMDCVNPVHGKIISLTTSPNPMDASTCEKLLDQDFINDCYQEIAEKRKDASICGKIKDLPEDNNYFKEKCYNRIAVVTKNPSICNSITNEFGQRECVKDVAIRTLNPSVCDNILDTYILNSRGWCLGIFKNSKSLEEDKQYNYYEYQAKEDLNPVLCAKVGSDELDKDDCYHEIAILKKDASICNFVTFDSSDKDECYYDVAVSAKKSEICQNIQDLNSQNDCYFNVAKASQDYTVCNNIQKGLSFLTCQE